MALLRDPPGIAGGIGWRDTAWVMHWHSGVTARVWRADSMQESSFGRALPTSDNFNAFCAGQTVMADGRLMVVGGTQVGFTGEPRVAIFDIDAVNGSSGGWSFADTTDYPRWYATVTALGDGKVLATSGTQFTNLHLFGGHETEGTATRMNDARVLNLGKRLPWESDQTTGTRPTGRHGHTAVWHFLTGKTTMFGGMKDTASTLVPTNEVWQLFIQNGHQGQDWSWAQVATTGDPSVSEFGGKPQPRHRHTAVLIDTSMVIYGGLGKDAQGQDVALGDLWRLNLMTLQWKRDATSAPPGARYGHAAVPDSTEDPGNPSSPHRPIMLVYGGRTSSTGFATQNVWVLTVDARQGEAPIGWRQVATCSSTPGAREGHVAVADRPRDHRMVIFGGNRQTGGLDNDTWELKQQSCSGTTDWHWTELNPSTRPSDRARHAAIYDREWERLLIFGGDTTPEGTAGGEVDDLWELSLKTTDPNWVELWDANTPSARQGHAMALDERPVQAKVPERYSPATNTWEKLEGTGKAGWRWLVNYPFIHQLRNGKVLYGGNGPLPRDTSAILSLATPSWSNLKSSTLMGGSSVLTYAPAETVMKFGTSDHLSESLTNRSVFALVDSVNGATTWTEGPELKVENEGEDRRFHNLTFVPDGSVLLTSGWRSDDGPAYGLTPFFYRSRNWEKTGIGATRLADDQVRRGYHSTAVLLPDARVLCAAGIGTDDTLRATIFSPPYLYSGSTTLATRPFFTTMPSYNTVHYGEPIWTGVDASSISSIGIVSLIRPAAVTHGFDQNQRYVQPLFTKDVINKRMRIVVPPNANTVPPGDYMLFMVKSNGVPSVARWLRIASESDVTAPDSVTNLDGFVQYGSNVLFTWTAQGDDNAGPRTARKHELRYSTSAITEGNWSSASIAATGGPRPAGETESVVVTGFSDCTTYYFAVKTFDEVGNASTLSNVVEFQYCPGGELASGRVRRGEQEAEVATASSSLELIRLPAAVGGLNLDVVNIGSNPVRVDSLGLLVASESSGLVAIPVGGQLSLGERRSPGFVHSSVAGDVAALLRAGGYETRANETLMIQGASGATHLRIETSRVSDNTFGASGIAIEAPVADTWNSLDQWYPGPGDDSWLVSCAGDSVRLVSFGATTIAAIDWVVPTNASINVVEGARVELEHSAHGEIDSQTPLAAGTLVLDPGERVRVGFAAGQVGASSLFLSVGTSGVGTPTALSRVETSRPLPTEFALGQNEPNPFGEGTLIRFALPSQANVVIEVFDVHGRRVHTLAWGDWQAGHHVVAWDGRNGAGQRLSPGVYLYRMDAGQFRATRKLAILP